MVEKVKYEETSQVRAYELGVAVGKLLLFFVISIIIACWKYIIFG